MADDLNIGIGVELNVDSSGLDDLEKKAQKTADNIRKSFEGVQLSDLMSEVLFNDPKQKFKVAKLEVDTKGLEEFVKDAKAAYKDMGDFANDLDQDWGDVDEGISQAAMSLNRLREGIADVNEQAQAIRKAVGFDFTDDVKIGLEYVDILDQITSTGKALDSIQGGALLTKLSDGLPVIDTATFADALTRAYELAAQRGQKVLLSSGFIPGREAARSRDLVKYEDKPLFDYRVNGMEMRKRSEAGLTPATQSTWDKLLERNQNNPRFLKRIEEVYNSILQAYEDALIQFAQDAGDEMDNVYSDKAFIAKIQQLQQRFGGFTPDLNNPSFSAQVAQDLISNPYAIKQATPIQSRSGKTNLTGPNWVNAFFRNLPNVATEAQNTIPESMAAPLTKGTTEDWKTKIRRILTEQLIDQGSNFAVALDTEFNHAIDQNVTELSMVYKTLNGEVKSLFDFIHVPLDPAGLAKDPTPFGAKSVKDLQKRAGMLGLDPAKLGDVGGEKVNKELLYKKAKALTDVLQVLQELNIPITGSNLSAEQGSIGKLIKFVNTFAESIGQAQLPTVDVKQLSFDSVKAFKGLQNTDPLKQIMTQGGAGLGTLIANALKDPKLSAYVIQAFGDIIQQTEKGFAVTGVQGGKLPAHFAQADAIVSLIVKELFSRFANPAQATTVIPTPKTSGAGGGGKPPTNPPAPPSGGGDDPMGPRRADALARAFHTQSEYTRMLAGLTKDEKEVIYARLAMLQKSAAQNNIAAAILEKESQLTAKKAALKTFTAGTPEYQAARKEVEALDSEIIKLTNAGRKNEAAVIAQVLSEGRYKDMQEKVTENTRKQIDLDVKRNQAGKEFTASIKRNLKDELEAQKALQRANKEQINQWVTARYALYDVGNFYTNVYQQMFRLTKQIFDTTQAYRTFETAFTPVERAMQLTGDAAVQVRDQFIKMSEQLPITFEELSKIATLGAQMGISAGGIQGFTKTIAEFSAITAISADTVAQKFGRIAELAKVDSSQFENLASAVAYAGVNAVATESEILNLSEAIAAVSTNAGFTPQEVIGMSTALASVGVQAEQARGVFTRVFADIDRAVSKGGSGLDAFAKVSGISAEQFATSWKTQGESYNVFRKLLAGLGTSSDITKSFDALNIVESREINTLTRLAKSLGVVDQAMSDSNASYSSGTFLGDSFNKTVDNLDAQLVIFKNNLDSFAAAFSSSFGGTLKDGLKVASEMLEFLKGASGSGIAKALLPSSAMLTASIGGVALLTAGYSKLIAQIYALRVAQIQRMNSENTDITSNVARIKQLTGAYSGLIEVRSGLKGEYAATDKRGVVMPVTFSAAEDVSARKNEAIARVKAAFEADSLKAKAKALITTQLGNLATSRENELLKTQNILLFTAKSTEEASVQSARAKADAVQRIIEARKAELALAAEGATVENMSMYVRMYGDQAEAISETTIAKLQSIVATKGLQSAEGALAQQTINGFKLINTETQVATSAQMTMGSKILSNIAKFAAAAGAIGMVVSAVFMLAEAIARVNDLKFLEQGGGVQSLRDAIAEDTKAWKENGNAISTVQVEYTDYKAVASKAREEVVSITGASGDLANATDTTTTSIKNQTLAIGQNTKEWMLNAIVGNEKVQEWLKNNPELFNNAESALKEYGNSFSEVIQSMLADPKGGQEKALKTTESALGKVQAKLSALRRTNAMGGVEFTDPKAAQKLLNQETALIRIITLIKGMGSAFNSALNMSSFVKSMKEALGITDDLGDSISNTTTKVKTLTQWSGEVGQVMQSAFDIRYGKNTALDNIRKAWSDLKKKADDAKKAIKKAQDQINSLKANRSVLQYQLDVALRYGDSKRAAEIQAKLDENTTSTSEAQDQLAEAQKNASTELRDGSDAAIQNRAALGGLLQSYIPYIQALLNSGKSQKEVATEVDKLKKEFAAQAKEIGFADSDLTGYLGTFDTYKTVVQKMPKDVTVKVTGLDAATRAMREFASALTDVSNSAPGLANVEKALTSLYSKSPSVSYIGKQAITARIAEKQALIEMYRSIFPTATTAQKLQYVDRIQIIGSELKQLQNEYKNFAVGGYVTGPGTSTSDSIPAMLSNGEYVMSASSVSGYGVGFMNALNQNRVMFAPATQAAQNNQGGSQLVYLSPEDRSLLRAAIDRPVNLYANGTQLARSVNNGNKVLAQRGTV